MTPGNYQILETGILFFKAISNEPIISFMFGPSWHGEAIEAVPDGIHIVMRSHCHLNYRPFNGFISIYDLKCKLKE